MGCGQLLAARLFVAPSTVNSHLKRMYAKLGVRSRREAIAQVQATYRGRHKARLQRYRPTVVHSPWPNLWKSPRIGEAALVPMR